MSKSDHAFIVQLVEEEVMRMGGPFAPAASRSLGVLARLSINRSRAYKDKWNLA